MDLGFGKIKDIYIEGHTDSDDSEEYNVLLSLNRSSSVEEYLLQQGVKQEMLHTESFGESYPMSENKSENRRCVVSFIYIEWNALPQNPVFVVLNVVDAYSKKPLPSTYTLDLNGAIHSGRTNKKGKTHFKYDPSISTAEIVTSANGYLNERVVLKDARPNESADTFTLTVPMHKIRVVQRMSFKNIYFHTDSDSLKPESDPDLKKLLSTLEHFSTMYIEIQGHMNYPTSRPMNPMQQIYNYNLSYKRAKKIYSYLVENGISRERLTYKGMSNRKMIFNNPQSRAQEDANKRVEIWTLQKVQRPN